MVRIADLWEWSRLNLAQPLSQHTRSPLAAMPVLGFPQELLAELFDAVVHMIPMGEAARRFEKSVQF